MRNSAPIVLALPVVIALGCAGQTRIGEGPVYPGALGRAPTLDIQVFRFERRLELTNTTAQAFGPSILWLNAWHGRHIDGLAVGQSLRLPLREFRDRYGGAFRGGGFFASEPPERLVLAELQPLAEDPAQPGGRLFGLIVVPQEQQ